MSKKIILPLYKNLFFPPIKLFFCHKIQRKLNFSERSTFVSVLIEIVEQFLNRVVLILLYCQVVCKNNFEKIRLSRWKI